MADRNPLLVTGKRSILSRILHRGAEGHGDPAEFQRVQAELERTARIAALRAKTGARRKPLTRSEAFLGEKVGEPGSRRRRGRDGQRARERRHYGVRHGRQHRIPTK